MISIVIPLYNKEKQLLNTLQSVFNQTFSDYEIVIVNDGSTDQSVKIVKQIKDARIRLIEQPNQGVSVARNKGIEEAKYDYIALLDADDEWIPSYLETQIDLINSFPDCSVYACGYKFKEEKRTKPIILNKISFKGEKGVLNNYFEVASCSHPPICSINIVAKKEAFLAVGAFPVGVKSGEDLITWAKLAINYNIAYNLNTQAYFIISKSESYESSPSRYPDIPDLVGKELKMLFNNNPNERGLKKYIGFWHKMRASIFLLLGDKKNALREILISLKFNLFNYKVWVYLFLLPIPSKNLLFIFKKMGNQ